MGLKLQKKEAAPPAKSPEELELEQLADAIGGGQPEFKAAKEIVDKYNAWCKRLRALVNNLDGVSPEHEVTITGEKHSVKVGACQMERSIGDKKALMDALGASTFFDLANFKLGDLDKYLSPEQAANIITSGYGTTRSLEVVA